MVQIGPSHIRIGAPVLDSSSEDDLAFLLGVGDDFGGGGKVGRDTALEVERHPRVSGEIGDPIPWKTGSAGEIEDAIEIVEIDLDSSSLTGLPAGCGDVDYSAPAQGLFDCCIHIGWNRTASRVIPGPSDLRVRPTGANGQDRRLSADLEMSGPPYAFVMRAPLALRL